MSFNFFFFRTDFDVFLRKKVPLSPSDEDSKAPYIQYATWSPEGTSVAFVYENDIYYKPKVHKNLVCRITTSNGSHIFNGVPDWLYGEEIWKTDHTMWFSPDGLFLMYLSLNDTKVGKYEYIWYDEKITKRPYPSVRYIHYPKVCNYLKITFKEKKT